MKRKGYYGEVDNGMGMKEENYSES